MRLELDAAGQQASEDFFDLAGPLGAEPMDGNDRRGPQSIFSGTEEVENDSYDEEDDHGFEDEDDDGGMENDYDYEDHPDEARYPMAQGNDNEEEEHSDSFSYDDPQDISEGSSVSSAASNARSNRYTGWHDDQS